MSNDLDAWIREHGVPPGAPVAPYQANERSPWDETAFFSAELMEAFQAWLNSRDKRDYN
jgi:hypothetical protein